jgi:hypothetical protein
MYKVRFYLNNTNTIGIKIFKTMQEAVEFSRKVDTANIIDTVLMKEDE